MKISMMDGSIQDVTFEEEVAGAHFTTQRHIFWRRQ